MNDKGPASWPAGTYAKAKEMWIAGELPVSIITACKITRNALFNVRKRYDWPARSRLALGKPMTEAEIINIERDWNAGMSINAISVKYNRGSDTITRLARVKNWTVRDLTRPALPAGHPEMWQLICQGSSLEGMAYPR